MYNLIRSEFYKLKCDKTYKSTLIITGLLMVVCIMLMAVKAGYGTLIGLNDIYGFIINKFKDINKPTVLGILNSAQGFSPVLQILVAFFVTSFVLNEYDYGTFKNSISIGSSRIKIYISKLMIISFGILIITFFMLFGSVLVGTIFGKASGFFNYNTILQMFKSILLSWFIFTAMASLYMCFSIIVKSKAIVIAAVIVILFGEPIILIMTNHVNYGDYLPSFLLMKICSMPLYGQAVYNIVITSVMWIIITSIIGISIFKNQDVK